MPHIQYCKYLGQTSPKNIQAPIICRLLILSALFVCQLGFADPLAPITLTENNTEYRIAGHISYLEDQDGMLDLSGAKSALDADKFKFAGPEPPNFGLTTSVYWLYFSIENQHPGQNQWWLELDNPVIDRINLYTVSGSSISTTQQSGDHRPLSVRTVKHGKPLFKIEIPYKQSKQIFIRLDTHSTLSAPMKIWSPEKYPHYNALVHMGYGLFYGGIIALLLYNLMLFFSIRDLNYLYYCAFVACSVIYQFCGDGLGYAFLWQESGHINLPIALTASNLGTVFLLQFARMFLRGKELFPKLDKALLVLMAIGPSILLLYLAGDQTNSPRLQTMYSTTSILLVLAAGIIALLKGLQEARYYLFAWIALIIGIILYNLSYNGVIPSTFFTLHAMQIGSILETILLSFALAHRMKILKEENERIQEQAKQSLEQSVKERTEELNTAMQDLARANAQLKETSFNDGLTGVRNRAYFEEQLEKEWFRSRREQKPIALLMLDIDHFKSINDNYGHLCGDHALITVAAIMSKVVSRPSDIVARYGGEEFVVLLPNTEAEGARFLAERIRRDLEKNTLEFNTTKLKLTASIGCSAMIPAAGNLNPHELINIADKALYAAKESGRNRVHTAKF